MFGGCASETWRLCYLSCLQRSDWSVVLPAAISNHNLKEEYMNQSDGRLEAEPPPAPPSLLDVARCSSAAPTEL